MLLYLCLMLIVGYGIRVWKDGAAHMKRPRRYTPYGDKDGVARTYKNIVPAPAKGVDGTSTPVATGIPVSTGGSATSVTPVIVPKAGRPKRKRDDESDGREHPQPVFYEPKYSSDHSCNLGIWFCRLIV